MQQSRMQQSRGITRILIDRNGPSSFNTMKRRARIESANSFAYRFLFIDIAHESAELNHLISVTLMRTCFN